jgi:signal transduction histidine kinase
MLVSFIVANREEIIARTRAQIAKRLAPRATEGELTTGIPLFLDQLVETLRHVPAAMIGAMEAGAAMHGAALLGRGYTVAQVVHDYGDVCQAITQLAHETGAAITADEFQTLNLSLDRVIAAAVAEYSRLRDLSASAGETERLGVFSHELRNQLTSAVLAFHAIRSGKAPIGGSVASVLARSLQSMTSIISQTLVEVRLDSGMTRHQRTNVRNLVEEAEVGGTLEAGVHGVSLSVEPVDPAIAVNADPQILAGALANLLQNAFKFTHAGGHVSVRAAAVDARVQIEVEDECGGLPPGKLEELFGAFTQRGQDRTGLGLGLFISRKGIAACGGELRARDIAGKGCVFTIDLPVLTIAS